MCGAQMVHTATRPGFLGPWGEVCGEECLNEMIAQVRGKSLRRHLLGRDTPRVQPQPEQVEGTNIQVPESPRSPRRKHRYDLAISLCCDMSWVPPPYATPTLTQVCGMMHAMGWPQDITTEQMPAIYTRWMQAKQPWLHSHSGVTTPRWKAGVLAYYDQEVRGAYRKWHTEMCPYSHGTFEQSLFVEWVGAGCPAENRRDLVTTWAEEFGYLKKEGDSELDRWQRALPATDPWHPLTTDVIPTPGG